MIRELHTGELVTFRGEHFDVDSARIWDLPEQGVDLAVAVSGDEGLEELAPLADHLIAVQPEKVAHRRVERRVGHRDRLGGAGRRPDPDLLGPLRGGRGAARPRAVPLVRRRLEGQRRPPDADGLLGREPVRAARGRRRESIPCGPDLDAVVEAVRPWWEAGFTDVALVQVGGEHQQAFLDEAAGPLLEKLRQARRPPEACVECSDGRPAAD